MCFSHHFPRQNRFFFPWKIPWKLPKSSRTLNQIESEFKHVELAKNVARLSFQSCAWVEGFFAVIFSWWNWEFCGVLMFFLNPNGIIEFGLVPGPTSRRFRLWILVVEYSHFAFVPKESPTHAFRPIYEPLWTARCSCELQELCFPKCLTPVEFANRAWFAPKVVKLDQGATSRLQCCRQESDWIECLKPTVVKSCHIFTYVGFSGFTKGDNRYSSYRRPHISGL